MFPIRSLTPQQAAGNALAAGFNEVKFQEQIYIVFMNGLTTSRVKGIYIVINNHGRKNPLSPMDLRNRCAAAWYSESSCLQLRRTMGTARSLYENGR
jgi:hypothetical protein